MLRYWNYLIMRITNNFERKLFFVFGRHIWNVIGVSGFVALLAGSILFLESFSTTNLKSKKQFFGRSYATTLKTEKQYYGKKYIDSNQEFLNLRRKLEKSGQISDYPKWIKEMKNKENGYVGYWSWSIKYGSLEDERDFVTQHEEYRKRKYLEYEKKVFYQNLPPELIKKIENQDNTYKNYKSEFLSRKEKQEKDYQEYKNKVTQKNSLKYLRRTTSLLPIACGFGVLSLSSVISTIFSIERNTRKLDQD